LFYNWPLTIGRRVRKRFERRSAIPARYWHVLPCSLAAATTAAGLAYVRIRGSGELPSLREIWWFMALMPLLCGMVVTLGAGGASMWKRIIAAVVCGLLTGALSTVFVGFIAGRFGGTPEPGVLLTSGVWQMFVFASVTPLGAILTELAIPDPELG
jgi:hypothetical protein